MREGRAAAALTGLGVIVIALIPGEGGPPSLIGWDKVDHAAAFAALTVLARCGWPGAPRLALAAVMFGFGIAIELGQAFLTTGRVASAADLAANAFGIALGLAASWVLGRAGAAIPALNRRR